MRWHSLTHDSERGWWCRTRLSIDSLFFGVVLPFFVSVENVFFILSSSTFLFFFGESIFPCLWERTNERTRGRERQRSNKQSKEKLLSIGKFCFGCVWNFYYDGWPESERQNCREIQSLIQFFKRMCRCRPTPMMVWASFFLARLKKPFGKWESATHRRSA